MISSKNTKDDYIKYSEAMNILRGCDSAWSVYYMRKAIKQGIINTTREGRLWWLLRTDIEDLKKRVFKLNHRSATIGLRNYFKEIFDNEYS